MNHTNKIKRQLKELFDSDSASQIYSHIEKLITDYKKTTKQKRYELDETQTTLITYADQFTSNTSNPLQTHIKFIEKWLAPEINTIHFLPFYPSSSDGGFSVIDYNKIDPEFGTWNDLETCQQHMMFDSVFNHISAKSYWFTQWLAGNDEYQDYFITFTEDEYNNPKLQQQLTQVTRPRVTPLLTTFTRNDGIKYYVWTTFSADQIDLNLKNPKVMISLLDSTFLYFKMGAKLLRIDAIPFYWKELGTNCVHLEKTHIFVKLLRAIVDELNQGHQIITESNVPHQENISYWGEDDEAHMVYNFTLPPLLLHGFLNGDATYLHKWSSSISATEMSTFFNITATHDGIGVRPVEGILSNEQIDHLAQVTKQQGGEIGYRSLPDGSKRPYELNITWSSMLIDKALSQEINIEKLVSSQLIQSSFPGLPAFYIHSLLGSYNDLELMQKTKINRDINRQKFQLEKVEKALESNGIGKRVLTKIKEALSVRKNHSAFHPLASKEDIEFHPQVWSFYRKNPHSGEKILVLLNLAPQNITIKDKCIQGDDLLRKSSLHSEITLSAYQLSWIATA